MSTKDKALAAFAGPNFPMIVCLCGSGPDSYAFQEADRVATLSGHIVLSVGNHTAYKYVPKHFSAAATTAARRGLDDLCKCKIDIADELLVLNAGGYIGESTRSEIDYAEATGKRVRYWEAIEVDAGVDLVDHACTG
jgi:hypothetical protein